VRYFPVDFRTAEHFDFVFQGCVHSAIVEGNVMNPVDGSRHWLPLEYCTTLNPDWFWSKDRYYSHPSAATIADWWLRARSSNSNLLLNAGPDNRGLLPEYHREYLRQARRLFER
jgi:alpha-L-fucosidase